MQGLRRFPRGAIFNPAVAMRNRALHEDAVPRYLHERASLATVPRYREQRRAIARLGNEFPENSAAVCEIKSRETSGFLLNFQKAPCYVYPHRRQSRHC